MKIMQMNIWLGNLLASALRLVEEENPDILCVQEVCSAPQSHPLFGNMQTHEQLSDLFPHQFFAPTFSYEMLGETCLYGNAIYSKLPLENRQVTFTVGEYQDKQTIADFTSNIRNVQTCFVELDSNRIAVANHHGYHDRNFDGTPEATESMQKVVDVLRTLDTPLVVCGDMNASPTSTTLQLVDAIGLTNLTVQSGLTTTLSPVHRFDSELVSDYIFVSPELHVESFCAADAIVSDHKAFIATLSL